MCNKMGKSSSDYFFLILACWPAFSIFFPFGVWRLNWYSTQHVVFSYFEVDQAAKAKSNLPLELVFV